MNSDKQAHVLRRGLTLLTAMLCGAAAHIVHAQDRETLETKVTAKGDRVVLTWSKKHPWDAEMRQRGVTLEAEYRNSAGAVALDCLNPSAAQNAAGRRFVGYCQGIVGVSDQREEGRSLLFVLPDALAAAPSGRVCLMFRLASQKILPLRRSNDSRGETARFQYLEWENLVVRSGREIGARATLLRINAEIELKSKEITLYQTTLDRNKWTNARSCQSIAAPNMGASVVSREAVLPSDQENVVRLICTMQVQNNVRFIVEEKRDAFDVELLQPPSVLERIVALLPRATMGSVLGAERVSQLSRYRDDWNSWSSQTAGYQKEALAAGYNEPPFGTFDEKLLLQSGVKVAGVSIGNALANKRTPAGVDIAAYVGGSVDAYSRCVSDGKKQVDINYHAITQLRNESGSVTDAAQKALVADCNAGVKKMERLQQELKDLQNQELQIQRELSNSAPAASLPGTARDLNRMACAA